MKAERSHKNRLTSLINFLSILIAQMFIGISPKAHASEPQEPMFQMESRGGCPTCSHTKTMIFDSGVVQDIDLNAVPAKCLEGRISPDDLLRFRAKISEVDLVNWREVTDGDLMVFDNLDKPYYVFSIRNKERRIRVKEGTFGIPKSQDIVKMLIEIAPIDKVSGSCKN